MKTLLLILLLASENTLASNVTLTVEVKSVIESTQLNRVKIIEPIFRVSDPDIFGVELIYPAINSIDEVPSNGRYTAQFICTEVGYGNLLGAEDPQIFRKQPILRFMDSSNPAETTFKFYKDSHYDYSIYRSVFCRIN